MENRLLTIEQTADYLSTTPGNIYNMIHRDTFPVPVRKIPGLGIRIDKRLIDKWIHQEYR